MDRKRDDIEAMVAELTDILGGEGICPECLDNESSSESELCGRCLQESTGAYDDE